MASSKPINGPINPKKTSISIDPDLWEEVRIRAIREKKDASEITAEALRHWLNRPLDHKKPTKS